MALDRDLIRLINRLARERDDRERRMAFQLLKIYREARQEMYIRFLESQGNQDTFALQHIEGVLADMRRQMQYYTRLTVQARENAIEEAHVMGQDITIEIFNAGAKAGSGPPGMLHLPKLTLASGVGLVNKGMVQALIGDIPRLAGKVEDHILFKIRDELTRGALMGESIPKLAKRVLGTGITQEGLKKPFPSIEKRCTTIARTEIIKASDQGYEDMAVEAQRLIGEEIFDAWITAGDSRVEAECRSIANGMDPRFKSIAGHPGVYRRGEGPRPVVHTHPNCRCRRVPILLSWINSGILNLAELRGARSGKS